MNTRDYLTRISQGHRPTPAERLEYLEACLERDQLSRDSRAQLYRQIDELKAEIRRGA